eukprot:1158758-Pelagomonas_calceolata.AAC.14
MHILFLLRCVKHVRTPSQDQGDVTDMETALRMAQEDAAEAVLRDQAVTGGLRKVCVWIWKPHCAWHERMLLEQC